MSTSTFIIDCPTCKAKVAAITKGAAEIGGQDEHTGDPFGEELRIGQCPVCSDLLAGRSYQIDFGGYDAPEDRWSDFVRVYPKPSKVFSSYNIPKVVKDSLSQADKCMQVGAHTAACVMTGRAIEAVCRHALHPEDFQIHPPGSTPPPKKKVMLAEGLKKLKETAVIDERLYAWGTELHAFRNLAAHPDDFVIDREDAEDIYNFAIAIVEYIYDLAERYAEFKARQAKKKK